MVRRDEDHGQSPGRAGPADRREGEAPHGPGREWPVSWKREPGGEGRSGAHRGLGGSDR